jgi:rhamnulokinase
MANYYLAVDLGASGGRHILGHAEGGKLVLQEVHRFSNAPLQHGGALIWEEDRIFGEIVQGLVKCREAGAIPRSVGIDTWGVDYALIDKQGELIKPVFAYRDSRTEPFLETAMPFEELYRVTGIARQSFNTIYQVLADQKAGRLEKAEYLLQLPEYFSQRLTGELRGKEYNEYTMASKTGLLDARRKIWADPVFEKLGLPRHLFKDIREPPYAVGELSRENQELVGFNTQVVMIASHDTASAVALAGAEDLYLSSGTWSLLGVTGDPILTGEAREAGYTNEGAHNGRIRFLKNIMGLWVIQSLRRELGDRYSFAQLEKLAREAEKAAPPDWAIDVNLPRFLSPSSMIGELQAEYRRQGKQVPQTPGELAFAVYASLANCYQTAIVDLENITGKTYPALSIIGGGSKDAYLNTLTAAYTGKPVYAGPAEATATGNILLQMLKAGDRAVADGFAPLVQRSFNITKINTRGH